VRNPYSRDCPDAYIKILRFGIGGAFYCKKLAGGVNSNPSIIHFPCISVIELSIEREHHKPFTIATRNVGLELLEES